MKKSTLKSLSIPHKIKIGTAVNNNYLKGKDYKRVLAREFEILTPEIEMKFDYIHPFERDNPEKGESEWNFEAADEIVAFARENGMSVRGHALVWHNQVPEWLKREGIDKRAVLNRHIHTVMNHHNFKEIVEVWDVVNEAINDDGDPRTSTVWWDINADPQNNPYEYVALAFTWANEANPKAKLFYNDYNSYNWSPKDKQQTGQHKKADAIYRMVRDLTEQGVPIHGIGLQLHLRSDSPPNLEAIEFELERYSALGIEVHITEMDVAIPLHGKKPSAEQIENQAAIYRDVLQLFLRYKSGKVFAMWGFTDQVTWIPEFAPKDYQGYGAPLIFDSDYTPKEAYLALKKSLGVPPV